MEPRFYDSCLFRLNYTLISACRQKCYVASPPPVQSFGMMSFSEPASKKLPAGILNIFILGAIYFLFIFVKFYI